MTVVTVNKNVNVHCRFMIGRKVWSPALKSDPLFIHPQPGPQNPYFLCRYIKGTLLPALALDVICEVCM